MDHYPSMRQLAAVWLHDYLSEHGETNARIVLAEAAGQGWGASTLRYGCAIAGVITRKLPSRGGGNAWRLSTATDRKVIDEIRTAIAKMPPSEAADSQ